MFKPESPCLIDSSYLFSAIDMIYFKLFTSFIGINPSNNSSSTIKINYDMLLSPSNKFNSSKYFLIFKKNLILIKIKEKIHLK